jgi:tetratricopeptide (TPR) repeat protein
LIENIKLSFYITLINLDIMTNMKKEHILINYICGIIFILVGLIFFLVSYELLFLVICLMGVGCFIIALYGDKRFSDKHLGEFFLVTFIIIFLILIYLYNVTLNNYGKHNEVIIVILAIMVAVIYASIDSGKIMFFGFTKVSQFKKGFKLIEKYDYEESFHYFDKIIKKDSDNPLAWVGRAYALQMLGKNQEALESVDHALNSKFKKKLNQTQINLVNSLVFHIVGLIYFNLKNYEKALEYADNGLNFHVKSNIDGLVNLRSIALNGLGRTDEAINCFDEGLKIKPKSGLLLNGKGALLVKLERYDDAIKCYKKSLEFLPKAPVPLNNIADALNKLGNYDEALEYINKALEKDSNNPMFWVTKGEICISLDKHEEALEYIDKALELVRNYEPAIEAKKQVDKLMN